MQAHDCCDSGRGQQARYLLEDNAIKYEYVTAPTDETYFEFRKTLVSIDTYS